MGVVAGSLLVLAVFGGGEKTMSQAQPSMSTVQPQTQTQPVKTTISIQEMMLRMDMRKLWEDHITWTRIYLISEINNSPDARNVAARLLKNQEDIGTAIKPYYGEESGNKLTQLLQAHIVGFIELTRAIKVNDQTAVTDITNKAYQNAGEIGTLLSSVNPNWPAETVTGALREHVDLTKQEAMDMANGNFDAGIADYDRIHDQALRMADAFSDGIVKQFPEKLQP